MTQADSVHSTPPTNTSANKPSRRGFLARAAVAVAGGAAIGAALPLPVSAGASERVPDPILAAIEVHKVTVAATLRAIHIHSALDRELPIDKCRSSITAWGEEIVPTDDPRWIDAERGLNRCHDAEINAACAIIDTPPTTMAGVVALLQYAIAADTDGEGWPSDLQSDDLKRTRSWQFFLIEMLADTLPGVVQA